MATGEIVQDWIYILNPSKHSLDGEPFDKDTVRRLAHQDPEGDFWLSRRNRMNPGDRLWFFFTSPDSEVAAVADVMGEPYEADPPDPESVYRVDVTLLSGPTDALHGDPVGRDELQLGQVRSVQRVEPGALEILLERAGL
ncbi:MULTISPECIES: EVE domain-containing protein [Streptomyces]|uniref:EVE domain-containing protein n=1 Tax=Streptomyces TaxID=1883 RepID=UPI001CEF8791|nr:MULTISPECIES: EVE domain-containing protein [Streptomyces]